MTSTEFAYRVSLACDLVMIASGLPITVELLRRSFDAVLDETDALMPVLVHLPPSGLSMTQIRSPENVGQIARVN